MNDRTLDPELVVEQIDLCFRILDDMELFLENVYTAIETALLRISQGFDNSLSPERWHADRAHAVSAFQALLPRTRL